MRFADLYLQQLRAFGARSPLPRVRALHLPPRRALDDNQGAFCALELEDGALGLSYVRMDAALQRLGEQGLAPDLRGADALEVAQGYADSGEGAQALGFAAANALTRCLYNRAGFVPPPSTDSIGQLHPQRGEHIGMIGFFKPLLGAIAESGARLTVLERNPELLAPEGGWHVTLDPSALADCSKVLSTGTLLLNGTLDDMLARCRHAAWFAMVGPSAGCLPDALFARGVSLLGGSWVHDGAGFVDALRRGERSTAFTGKFALTAANYPGFEALLARAAG